MDFCISTLEEFVEGGRIIIFSSEKIAKEIRILIIDLLPNMKKSYI